MALLISGVARAEDVRFEASVDRQQIGEDESVSLKFTIELEGSGSAGRPIYQAPDFDLLNSYQSSYLQSFYDNGKFGVRNTYQITHVLRPKKTGKLIISDVKVQVAGKSYSAPTVTVDVGPAGQGTPPPRRQGGGGGTAFGNATQDAPTRNFFVKAELSKSSVYKGEQLIVSYYLYQSVRTFNISVAKYPVLKGFLREDLEMPILGTHLNSESVVHNGVPYRRALLARYAAYPLEEGDLSIDSMQIKANYYPNRGRGADPFAGIIEDEEDDPFAGFFRQLTPKTATQKSDTIKVKVTPLPAQGRPASFTGGVGDFSVEAAVDKYDVRANEPVNLTVKIEGRGNLAAIGEPNLNLPQSVELYETKGRAKTGAGGVGQKIFETLLIPRAPGEVTIAPMEFSFFDPSAQKYVTRTTQPIKLKVGDPAPGTSLVQIPNKPAEKSEGTVESATQAPESKKDLHYLKPPSAGPELWFGEPIWRWIYWLAISVMAIFVLTVATDQILLSRKRRETQALSDGSSQQVWRDLEKEAKKVVGGREWKDVVSLYSRISEALMSAIDQKFQLGARSLSRKDLGQILMSDHGIHSDTWKQIEKTLEFAEFVRYASSAGVSEDQARRDLIPKVFEAEKLAKALKSP